MDRRTYLVTMAGTVGLIAVAGCVGGDDDTEARPTDDSSTDAGDPDNTTDNTDDTTDDTEGTTDDTDDTPDDIDDTTDDTDDTDGPSGPSQAWPQPGDEPSWSRRLYVGLHGTYEIEDGERHYFNVELSEGDQLTVTMYFNHDDGDLDLEVLGPDENVLDSSTSDSDDESVTIQATDLDPYTGTDVFYVVPYGTPGTTNEYNIEIEID